MPGFVTRALCGVCVLAGLSAVSAIATTSAPRRQPARPALHASLSSALGVVSRRDLAGSREGVSARADRSYARAALDPNPELVSAVPMSGPAAQIALAEALAGDATEPVAPIDPGVAEARAAAAAAALKAAQAAAAAAAEAARLAALPKWVRPSHGSLTSPFGTRWGRLHAGIDLAGGYGSPIVAAAAGVVLYAGPESGYGRVVKVAEPDGTQTWYGHMEKILVKAGDQVTPGEEIALVGAAGDATGPHLHFEVHVNGVPIDPVPFLASHGVRV